jgi:hypothetical protein
MQTMTGSFVIDVDGLPPAKSEAQSMLGARHPHASRVVALLAATATATEAGGVPHFGSAALGMEIVVRVASSRPSDLTNYAGGIADVLEEKGHRMALDHLGDLAGVALDDNDRQLCDVRIREERSERTGYTVRLWAL